jgi:hypothetical protein
MSPDQEFPRFVTPLLPVAGVFVAWAVAGTLGRLDATVPNIYAVAPQAEPVSLKARLLALAVAGGCLTILLLAAYLRPSPSGMGTHQQGLGLPACNFLRTTGLPCPSCGMTTSFAWFAKGNLLASAYVQPMGAILALLAAACVWGGFYIGLTGRPAHRLLRMLPAGYTLIPLLLLGVLAWGWKILIHLNGVDGWNP